MAIITSVGEDWEKLEPLYIAGRNVKWYSSVEKSLMVPQKEKHITTLSSKSIPRNILKKLKTCFYKNTFTNVLSSIIHNSQRV